MRWIKAHITESIIIGISLMMLIFILLFTKIFFFSDKKDVYGDRLDGIEDVKISNDKLGKIEAELKKNTSIEKASGYMVGKIIHFMVYVKEDADFNAMKEQTSLILQNFSKKEKEFYDIEVYLVTKGKDTIYPHIGYKGKGSDAFIWTKS